MSFEKKSEKYNNISKSLTLSKNLTSNNKSLNQEKIIKKNKIINIRIYQNYTSNKNTNTFYNQSTNNIIKNINNQSRITNEMGTQTLSINHLKKLSQKNGNNKYNFSKTFCTGIFKNDKSIGNKKKNKRKNKNISCNINYKKKNINNLKENTLTKKIKKEFFNEEEKNINKKIKSGKSIKNNETNNKSAEKNKIAKKYSLFDLKNDNKYLIINDGIYDTNYHENNKLSINKIYIREEQKNESGINNFLSEKSKTSKEKRLENYFLSEKNFHRNDIDKINKTNKISILNIKKNEKNISNKKEIKKEKFEKLSIFQCNNISFVNEKDKLNNINKNIQLINENNDKINNYKNFYQKFITNMHDSVNKFILEYKKINHFEEEKNFKEKEHENKYIFSNLTNNIINNISKESFQILSKNSQKIREKDKNKINKYTNIQEKNKDKKIIKREKINNKEKNSDKKNQKKNNVKNINEANKLTIKYDSFLQDMTQENDNEIKIEDLLKIYTEESIKANKSLEDSKNNNKIIGDEKTFFNNSKIPKIEECIYINNMKENDMNLINLSKNKKASIINENNLEKINLKNNYYKISMNKNEHENFNKIYYKRNIKQENNKFNDIIKSTTCTKSPNKYIFSMGKNYQKNINKEKMYNFLFNEGSHYNKNIIFDNKNKQNFVNNMINKIEIDIKSSTGINFYRNNNYYTSRLNYMKHDKRNWSYKNSYSKLYLNKLEIENKFLIPQLNRKSRDFFDVTFVL